MLSDGLESNDEVANGVEDSTATDSVINGVEDSTVMDAVINGVEDSTATDSVIENVETMEDEKIDNCCICMDSIDTNEKATLVPCNHQYHKKCIDQWFRTARSNRKCSYCRTSTSQIRHSFKPDGKFETETIRTIQTNNLVRHQIRFLMCIVTPQVYMYSLVTESHFTIVNNSSRTIELVDENSQSIQTLEPGWHQLNDTSLNYKMRFQNEPQIEFTLFNMNNFYTGNVLSPVSYTGNVLSPVAQPHLLFQTRHLLLQEFSRIEALRNERIFLLDGTNDDDHETPRMRRRRERIERTAQGPNQQRQLRVPNQQRQLRVPNQQRQLRVPNQQRLPRRNGSRGRGRRGTGPAN